MYSRMKFGDVAMSTGISVQIIFFWQSLVVFKSILNFFGLNLNFLNLSLNFLDNFTSFDSRWFPKRIVKKVELKIGLQIRKNWKKEKYCRESFELILLFSFYNPYELLLF